MYDLMKLAFFSRILSLSSYNVISKVSVLLLVWSSLLSHGCARRYSDFFPFDDAGLKKPSCIVLPIAVNASIDQPTSGEAVDVLYQHIYQELCWRGEIYMPRFETLKKRLLQLHVSVQEISKGQGAWNPHAIPWKDLRPFEYVALIEMIDCGYKPYSSDKSNILEELPNDRRLKAALLSCTMRVALFKRDGETTGKLLRLETIRSKIMCSMNEAHLFKNDPFLKYNVPGTTSFRFISKLTDECTSYIESSFLQAQNELK